ncbi:MAG: 16S rRNA (cytosine(967)-C(5))-methyltransferase RsmB [Ruminococcaceae bacterium]|nr:16S rRNA (cytosine(967)-C(5))-methyltransferase RsmB [Oscillospiraceae bacterium]
MKIKTPRELSFESLKKCFKDGKYSNLEVLTNLSRVSLEQRDKALYTALVYGVIEKSITLDWIIDKYSKLPVEELDADTLISLRLGIYQIMYMDRIPAFSACDESVKLVSHKSKSYVNAVLRNVAKNKALLQEQMENAPLQIKYSVPQYIIDIWTKGYGEEKTVEILKGFSVNPPLTLRVNTLKCTAEEILEHIEGHVHPNLPDIIYTSGNAEALYGFDEGKFFIQGSNSRYAVSALKLSPGETVIDTCSCPGGKSFSAAIDMQNKGKIYSFDLHANKLSLVTKGAKRLGIDIIETAELNATKPREDLKGCADAVICDVPCSGLGIIAKKPDIKYKNLSDIERLPEIQLNILNASSEYLKKGGRLMYSTCTLNPEENEKITDEFLKTHKGFHRAEGFPRTSFPTDLWEDGFFCDLIIKD